MGPSLASLSPIVKDFGEYLRLQLRQSPRTVEAYTETAERLLQFLGGEESPGQLLNADALRAFLREASKKLATNSQSRWVSGLKSFLRWGAEYKNFPPDLERILVGPKANRPLIRIFDEEDLSLLTTMLKSRPPFEQLLFELLYGSGLRISEARNVELKNLNRDATNLKVLGKGNKTRLVPLTSGATALFRTLKAQHALGPWPTETSIRSMRRWVERWGKLAALDPNVGHLHPHKLRHSIATHLLRRGAKLPQIQRLLGHERLSTTERYTHLNIEDVTKVYDQAFPNSLKKETSS